MNDRARVVTVLEGDGIGREILGPSIRATLKVAPYLVFERFPYGAATLGKFTDETRLSMESSKLLLKMPTGTPNPVTDKVLYKSPAQNARIELKTYSNVRPFSIWPRIKTRYDDKPLNLVIIRETSEGLYEAEEVGHGEGDDYYVDTTYRTSRRACKRIARFAFEFAHTTGRTHITIGHKATMLKKSHLVWLEEARKIAVEYPEIQLRELIIDNCAMQLAANPWQFEILLLNNDHGDILSDQAAGQVFQSLGPMAAGNIGDGVAMFEPGHGTAPDIAGQGKANPAAAMLSCALMLDYIGDISAAERLRGAIRDAWTNGEATRDLGGTLSTEAWADAVIARL